MTSWDNNLEPTPFREEHDSSSCYGLVGRGTAVTDSGSSINTCSTPFSITSTSSSPVPPVGDDSTASMDPLDRWLLQTINRFPTTTTRTAVSSSPSQSSSANSSSSNNNNNGHDAEGNIAMNTSSSQQPNQVDCASQLAKLISQQRNGGGSSNATEASSAVPPVSYSIALLMAQQQQQCLYWKMSSNIGDSSANSSSAEKTTTTTTTTTTGEILAADRDLLLPITDEIFSFTKSSGPVAVSAANIPDSTVSQVGLNDGIDSNSNVNERQQQDLLLSAPIAADVVHVFDDDNDMEFDRYNGMIGSQGASGTTTNKAKRSSLSSSSSSNTNTSSSHENMWQQRYEQLVLFHKQFRHVLVPMNWTGNPSLAHWVKRQRYQYKLKYGNDSSNGKNTRRGTNPSTLTKEREDALQALGFVWDSHRASWEERWNELKEFTEQHGHANVPKQYAPNQKLSVWVKCQRRQCKLLKQGERSNMTPDRIDMLKSLGFCFCPRRGDGRPMLPAPKKIYEQQQLQKLLLQQQQQQAQQAQAIQASPSMNTFASSFFQL